MERKIIKAIFKDLREKDIEITNKLSNALSGNAELEYIQDISAKSCLISDIRNDCRNNKSLHKPFAYLEYLKNLYAVAINDLVSASLHCAEKSEIHVIHAKTELLIQLMLDARYIISEQMDNFIVDGIVA